MEPEPHYEDFRSLRRKIFEWQGEQPRTHAAVHRLMARCCRCSCCCCAAPVRMPPGSPTCLQRRAGVCRRLAGAVCTYRRPA